METHNKVLQDTIVAMLTPAGQYGQSYMFYGHIIAKCRKRIMPELQAPAAITFKHDAYELMINPEMFEKFPLEARLGVLKHEMLHILNGHLNRIDDRVMLGWNYATDCAINQLIDRDHLPKITKEDLEGADPEIVKELTAKGKMPKVGDIQGILPENYPAKKGVKVPTNETAEHYYTLLEDPKDPQGNGSNSSSSSSIGDGMDDHSVWQEVEGDPELQKDITKKMIEDAMNNTQKARGNLPSQVSDWLSIHSRKAELDWRKVLRNIVGNKRANTRRTLMRRDRRFPNRPDIKGKTKDRTFNLLIVSDVSGSVDDNALLALLGEVQHICTVTNTAVDLIQVDAQAFAPEKLSKNTKIIERKASGGTILHPALEMAKQHRIDYNAIVVTTDGYLSSNDVYEFQKTNKRVIWLIEPNGCIMDEMSRGMMQAFKLKENR